MKKLLLALFIFFSIVNYTKADSYFLSGLEFDYLYGDNDFIQEAQEIGIDVNEFSNYLFQSDISLGEKTALIVALATHCEFKRSDLGDGDEYFNERVNFFLEKAKEIYGNENNFPVEVNFFIKLMSEYDSMNPDVDAYIQFAKKIPQSLTVESVKVIAMAYDIVYNDKRDFVTRKRYKDEFKNPYMTNKSTYKQDIKPDVYERITYWDDYIDDCNGKTKGEELTCQCKINSDKDLFECLNTVNEDIITKIKDAKIDDNVEDRQQSELLKATILNGIKLEKDYISSLKTSNINRSRLLYYYLKNIEVFCVDLEGFHRIIRGGYIFNRDTEYIRQFTSTLNLKECSGYSMESTISDNYHFFESECFKLYMQKLDKNLNDKYKELGGPSNLKLKKAQLAWLKMRDLHAKRKGNDFVTSPGQDELLEQNILANRVSAYNFYQNPDKIMEIISAIKLK